MSDHPVYQKYLGILLVVCAIILAVGVVVAWVDPDLAPYDAGNYVEVARNVQAGRGLSSQVVGNFYRRYPQIWHPEDRRASVWSLLLSGSMSLLGERPFAATLPNLLLGLLVGPLLVWALARRLRLAPVACFAAGALLLTWPYWLKESLSATADVLFTDLILLMLLLVISARKRPVLLLAAGALLGCAYTVKPAALFLVIPLVVFYWLDNAKTPVGRRLTWLAALLGVALVFGSPMLARNYLLFSNPIYSTNIHTAGHIGSDDSGRGLMHVYWNEPLPTFSQWVKGAGSVGVAGKISKQLWQAIRDLFIDGPGIFLVIPSVVVLISGDHYLRLRRLWVFLGLFVLQLAILWVVRPRLLLPVVPIMSITAAGGGLVIARRLIAGPRRATVVFVVVVGLVAVLGAGSYCWWRVSPHSSRVSTQQYVDAARWVKTNLSVPATLMSHYPYLIRFYSDRPVVQIPFDDTRRIRQVIAHYGVDTLIIPQHLPEARWIAGLPLARLRRLVEEAKWRRVYANRTVVVYRRTRR